MPHDSHLCKPFDTIDWYILIFFAAPLAIVSLSLHFPIMTDSDKNSETPKIKGKDKAKSDAAQERVAEALRANLRRRKVQSRDRKEQS